jgi:hypothetical protein
MWISLVLYRYQYKWILIASEKSQCELDYSGSGQFWNLLVKDRFHCYVDYSGSGQVPMSNGFFWLRTGFIVMWIPLALHRYQFTMDPSGFSQVPHKMHISDSSVSNTEYSGLE